jgi:hypothetical protein
MRGWAIDLLQEISAIRECEEHGWMQDRAVTRRQASPLTQRPPKFMTC